MSPTTVRRNSSNRSIQSVWPLTQALHDEVRAGAQLLALREAVSAAK